MGETADHTNTTFGDIGLFRTNIGFSKEAVVVGDDVVFYSGLLPDINLGGAHYPTIGQSQMDRADRV